MASRIKPKRRIPVLMLTAAQKRQQLAMLALLRCTPAERSYLFSLFNHAGQQVGVFHA